jgi:hypothetical protein
MAKCKTSISLVSKQTSAISLVSNLTKQTAGKQSKKTQNGNNVYLFRAADPRWCSALPLRGVSPRCRS